MFSTSISRLLAARQVLLRRPVLAPRLLNIRLAQYQQATRNASSQPGKPIVLEKPDQFRPPSHPARLPRKKIRNYGPALTQEQEAQQKTKQYPHMMPPEGSFFHSFLTDKWLHVWIAMSILFSLTFFMFLQDFLHTTVYRDLLPARSDLLSHPLSSMSQFFDVYKMHIQYVSAQTAEKRRKNLEDVQKREEYRRAHGKSSDQGFWSPRKEEAAVAEATAVENSASVGIVAEPEANEYVDFDGKKKPVKKWLGIW